MRTLIKHTATVRGYPTRCTIKFAVTDYAPLRRNTFTGVNRKGKRKKASPQPDKIKEITTILPAERDELVKVLEREIVAGIARVREKRVIEIK